MQTHEMIYMRVFDYHFDKGADPKRAHFEADKAVKEYLLNKNFTVAGLIEKYTKDLNYVYQP